MARRMARMNRRSDRKIEFWINNSPDSFLNGFTRLSGLTVPGSSYFSKVSSTPDFDHKILSTAESGFDAQNLLKFCPEYWIKNRILMSVGQFLLTESASQHSIDPTF